MPYQALTVLPGVNVEKTQMLNESGWSFGSFIRFFQGILQKLGGWTRLSSTPVVGTARALCYFADFSNNQYIGIGTEQKLEVYNAGMIYDITPVSSTSQLSTAFSTVTTSHTVKVTDAAGAATQDNWINIINPVSVGGVVLQGPYKIQSIVDATHYNITSPTAATSTVTNGGSAAKFTTTNLSSSAKVTLANNGYVPGSQYTVYISTSVGGLTFFGTYSVDTIIDADNFTITPGGTASSSTSGFENSGNIEVQYQIDVGLASAENIPGLYGSGPYGGGPYGSGVITVTIPPRIWSLGAWGTDLVASYTQGPIYVWQPTGGVINNPATLISQSPKNINSGIFIAMPQQQIVALGTSVGTSTDTDFLLIRWCDIGDYTDWVASATNQAGSFRIPRGSRIVGGLQGPQQGLIWTDIGLWAMQYIGFPLVYGFNELAEGCGLIGQNAKGVLGGKVIWMSINNFFIYDGNSVQSLQCPVWDKVFTNINKDQAQKIIAAPNSYFNEMWFFWPSAGSGEIDSYVKINMNDGSWDYGSLVRTAWIDQSAFLTPLGVDENGLIQQHELGNDADGQIMNSSAQTGWFKISDGTLYTFLERLIPDFIYDNATLKLTIYVANYPYDTPVALGPFTVTEATEYVIVRARGRLVSIKVESNDLGSFWRLGQILYSGSQAGRR